MNVDAHYPTTGAWVLSPVCSTMEPWRFRQILRMPRKVHHCWPVLSNLRTKTGKQLSRIKPNTSREVGGTNQRQGLFKVSCTTSSEPSTNSVDNSLGKLASIRKPERQPDDPTENATSLGVINGMATYPEFDECNRQNSSAECKTRRTSRKHPEDSEKHS